MRSYFVGPKNIRLNSIHYFIIKTINKQELYQIAINHSSDIEFKDLMNRYKKCTPNDTALPPDDPVRFRCNLNQN